MKKLTDEGILDQSVDQQSREYLYRLADGEKCCCKVRMRCKKCGKIIELDNGCSHKLLGELLMQESFSADNEIVISGICQKCM